MPSRTQPDLIIRADAGPRIGVGHLMRCIALAESWTGTQGKVVFVTGTTRESLRKRLERGGHGLVEIPRTHPDPADLRATIDVLKDHPTAWAAVDGYAFDEAYHRGLRATGHPILALDDTGHLPVYEVDALLNQNAHADLVRYHTLPRTKRLLGPSYILLRREFRARRQEERTIPPIASRILVTMGGADPGNATRRVVEALLRAKASDLQATVVVGPENPRRASLERPIRDAGARIELVAAADDMSALMDAADLAIVTGGSSVWELAYLGVPALVLTAGPQEELLAQGLKRERLFRVLGRTDTIDLGRLTDEIYNAMRDSDWRAETSRRGRELVDGNGADRVVQALKDLGGPSLA